MEVPVSFTGLACCIGSRIEKPAVYEPGYGDAQKDTAYMHRVIEALEARIAPAATFTYTKAARWAVLL